MSEICCVIYRPNRLLNTAPVNLIEKVPFPVTTDAAPYKPEETLPVCRRSLSLMKGDYSNLKHFKKCNGTAGSTIQKCKRCIP